MLSSLVNLLPQGHKSNAGNLKVYDSIFKAMPELPKENSLEIPMMLGGYFYGFQVFKPSLGT